MITVHYSSRADKAQRYQAETIPAMFAAAADERDQGNGLRLLETMLRARITTASKLAQLMQLHSFIRAGVYQPEHGPRDEIRSIRHTLLHGGDCDDWAPVLLAACRLLGVNCALETSGYAWDPFAHVYAVALFDGQAIVLDPKGSQLGVDFNRHSENNPVRRRWEIVRGRIVETAAAYPQAVSA